MKNKRPLFIVAATGFLLLIPLIAMQFTKEVNWSVSDFIVAGGLLLTTGLLCEIVLRKVVAVKSRIALCAIILIVLALIWIELAVGLFGSPFAGS